MEAEGRLVIASEMAEMVGPGGMERPRPGGVEGGGHVLEQEG